MQVTSHQVVRRFLRWAEKTLAPSTFEAYRHHLTAWLRATRDVQIRALKPSDLSAWAKTWHNAQAVIRAFNWAVKESRLLRTNPFVGVKKPRRGYRRRVLSPADLVRLLRLAPPAARAFLLALRETLGRPQEIRAATWAQLSADDPTKDPLGQLDEGKTAIVQWEFKDSDRRTETSRPRVLLITRRLGRLIKRKAAGRTASEEPLFLNSRGRPWTRNAVRCMMRRLRRKAGLTPDVRGENIVAYTLRHSQATLAVSRGVADRTLADLLGHVETRTTSRYLHLQRIHLRLAMERIAGDKKRLTKGD